MPEDDEPEGILVVTRKDRPTTRRERIMNRIIPDVRELSVNDIVTFYTHNDTVRYYVRLLNPIERQGIGVFHLNRKGRPSYRLVPRYTIRKDQQVALLFEREISAAILELLHVKKFETKENT